MSGVPTALRGEYEARVAGTLHRFDTTLATVAGVEERCGDVSIVEVLNRAVAGRRARDLGDLLTAALATSGIESDAARAMAGQASLAEAEAFVLAMIGALGFELGQRDRGGERPLAGASNGGAGAASRSEL